MKKVIKIIFIIFVIFNVMSSIIVTIRDVYTNNYFNEINNFKSFSSKKLYMNEDFLFINSGSIYTGADNGLGSFIIKGLLLSDNSNLELAIGKEEYLGADLDKQSLYKSKITGDFFLKDAPKEYYNYQFTSFYIALYLKISFYIIIGVIIYIIIRYKKNQKYRI